MSGKVREFDHDWRVATLHCSKPESGVHVTEMMTCDWSMITAYVFMSCKVVFRAVVYRFISCLFSAPEIFRYDTKKLVPKTVSRKWSRFMCQFLQHVSWIKGNLRMSFGVSML